VAAESSIQSETDITVPSDNPAHNVKIFEGVTRTGHTVKVYRNPSGSVSIWQQDDLVHMDRDIFRDFAESVYIEAHRRP
jgi:hypothetical protein